MRRNRLEDVWRYVEMRGSEECWPWKGYIGNNGYGKFRYGSEYGPAHRVVYVASRGAIPPGMEVMHVCSNKECCNPSHLTIGTTSENQLHYTLAVGYGARSNTGIQGVSFNRKRKWYRAVGTSEGGDYRVLYQGPSIFGAWAERMKWEINARAQLESKFNKPQEQQT